MNASRPPQRRGLGRGLGSLIPTAPATPVGFPGGAADGTSADGGAATVTSSTTQDGEHGTPGGSQAAEQVVPESGLAPVAGAYFAEVSLEQITPNRVQPRQVFDEEAMAELVHSIREVGLLQPVVVRRTGVEAYELGAVSRCRSSRVKRFTASRSSPTCSPSAPPTS